MPWGFTVRQSATNYLREHAFLLALVVILFVMGLIFGILAAGVLDKDQKVSLNSYIDQGLHSKSYVSKNHPDRSFQDNIDHTFNGWSGFPIRRGSKVSVC